MHAYGQSERLASKLEEIEPLVFYLVSGQCNIVIDICLCIHTYIYIYIYM